MASAVSMIVVVSVAGCGQSPSPPSSTAQKPDLSNSAAKTATAAPTASTQPVPQTVSIAGTDWTAYSGTIYTGCRGSVEYSGGHDAIHPRVFDTATGMFITPAVPQAAEGETITNEACVVTGTAPDLKIIYTMDTTKPASGLNPQVDKKTAYLYDMTTPNPIATKDISDFRTYFTMLPTSTGAVVDGATGAIGTVVLSNNDLSVLWTDPENASAADDAVISFPRHKENNQAIFDGLELRAPDGASLYREPEGNGASIFSDGAMHLVQLQIWQSHSPGILVTSYFDVGSRALLNIDGSERLPDSALSSTLSDGRLFFQGLTPIGGRGGMSVWNLQSHQMDFQRTPEQTTSLHISRVNFELGHLYIGTAGDPETYSVFTLPNADTPIATTWTSRPFGRLTGWTEVCKDEISQGGTAEKCNLVLVKDQSGGYPGPWS